MGDQADPVALLAGTRSFAPYDVIVDDGGHSMMQQLVSLNALLPLVRAGGVYVVEDLGSSFPERSAPRYRVDKPAVAGFTTWKYIAAMSSCMARRAKVVTRSWVHHPLIADPCVLARLVESIACSEEICTLARWSEKDTVHAAEPDWEQYPQRFYPDDSEEELPPLKV
jgi:hypothetical protein